MTITCRFCYAKQAAVKLRAKAQAWDDEGLPNLAGPYLKAVAEFEAMSEGAKSCTCGTPWEHWEPTPRKKVPLDEPL